MSIPNISRSPSTYSPETSEDLPDQDDECLVEEQQEKFLELIENDNGGEIERLLRSSTMFELSSGPCTLPQLLEKCDPPLMHRALETGNFVALHALIFALPPSAFNAKDDQGRTLLIRASQLGLADEVKFLLAAGAAISAADHDGNTSLMWAAAKGFANIVADLLGFQLTGEEVEIRRERNEFLDINATNVHGKNALMVACEAGHVEVVRTILAVAMDQNIPLDLDAKDKDLKSAWFYAANSGSREIVKAFIDAGHSLLKADSGIVMDLIGHETLKSEFGSQGLRTEWLVTPRTLSKNERFKAAKAWTEFNAPSSTSVSPKSSAPHTSATSSTSTSSAPAASALTATQTAPEAVNQKEDQISSLLERFGIEFDIDEGAVNVTSSGNTVLKNAEFFQKAEKLVDDNWFTDSSVNERQFWAYMAVGEVIVNTLHDSAFVTGSTLTVPDANGALVQLENSIEITHAIAWYCLALAGQRDQPQRDDDDRRVAKDNAPLYSIADPKGNLFNYLETLESTAEHPENSGKVVLYTVEDNDAKETLVVGAHAYFPGNEGFGLIYRRVADEGDNGQLVFRFPVMEKFVPQIESTDN